MPLLRNSGIRMKSFKKYMLLSYLAVSEAMSWNWQGSAATFQELRSLAVDQLRLSLMAVMLSTTPDLGSVNSA